VRQGDPRTECAKWPVVVEKFIAGTWDGQQSGPKYLTEQLVDFCGAENDHGSIALRVELSDEVAKVFVVLV
jgi:hypothetical protein